LTVLALVLAAMLAVGCVVLVALPFIREPEPESDALGELDEDERRRLELLEARDRALAALKELEFDHRTGTISDEDYRRLVTPLRRDAATALQALERRDGETDTSSEAGHDGEGRSSRPRTLSG
jgi:hypothetical protein